MENRDVTSKPSSQETSGRRDSGTFCETQPVSFGGNTPLLHELTEELHVGMGNPWWR